MSYILPFNSTFKWWAGPFLDPATNLPVNNIVFAPEDVSFLDQTNARRTAAAGGFSVEVISDVQDPLYGLGFYGITLTADDFGPSYVGPVQVIAHPPGARPVQEVFTLVGPTGTEVLTQDISLSQYPYELMPRGAVVADGLNSASTFKTNLDEPDNDYWRGTFLTFTAGDLAGQTRRIASYNFFSKFITPEIPFTRAPGAGDTFILVNR